MQEVHDEHEQRRKEGSALDKKEAAEEKIAKVKAKAAEKIKKEQAAKKKKAADKIVAKLAGEEKKQMRIWIKEAMRMNV